MPAADAADRDVRRRPDAALALWTGVAVIAAALPLTRLVISTWVPQTVLLVALVVAAGLLVRRTRWRGAAVLAELAVWVAGSVLALPAGVPRAGIVPLPSTFRGIGRMAGELGDEILRGVAPLAPSPAMSWLLLTGVGALAIAMTHIVVTARLPLLASIGLLAVALVPALIVPQRVEAVFFLPLAAAILLLLRGETRSRDARRGIAHTASVTAVAVGVGAAAIVIALVATSILPTPSARPGSGFGPTTSIDADLDLGTSLREPSETEVLSLTTSSGAAPYLRVATLSTFDGDVWTPDTGGLTSLERELPGIGRIDVDTAKASARIEITRLAGGYLPVPYALTAFDGEIEGWSLLDASRTLVSGTETSLGSRYEVEWARPAPTREQAQAATAGGDPARDAALALPELPDVVVDAALEATAGATTPYDRLRALQAWFRGGEFSYSLDAPVEDGFDGSGVDAIAEFLQAKAGYCVHFASAFAVMARSLGIPTRVVVGYLPGTATGDPVAGQTTYSYSSAQLHAWPEARLDGLGWVPFEPTASLGVPTNFLPDTTSGSGSGPATEPELPELEPTESAVPDAEQSAGPEEGGASGKDVAFDVSGPLAAIGALIAALAAAAIPCLVRQGRRRRRLTAAGDQTLPPARRAEALWAEVVDVAIDARAAVHASDSPRALGARLVTDRGAPADDVALLVAAVERAAYSPAGTAIPPASADALRRLSRALLPAGSARLRAAVLPRSLVVRPMADESA